MALFPRHTHPYHKRLSEPEWHHRGPPAFRKLAFSLVDMALVTGVVLRTGRALALTLLDGTGVAFAAAFVLGALLLFTMATLHLGNYPLRHWVWRVPLFAAAESAAEMLTSLGLIALGREPYGTARATFADWPAMALGVVTWRLIAIVSFSIVLAAVVQWARVSALRKEHRL